MPEMPILSSFPADVRSAALRVLLALLVVALIWLLRRAVTWAIARPLKQLVSRYPNDERAQLVVRVVQGPVNLLIIALSLYLASNIILPDRAALDFISNLARTLVIVAVALAAFRAVDLFIASGRALTNVTGLVIEEQLVPFTKTALKAIVVALAVVVVLQEWNYDVTSLIAGLGLAGLAVSLAAQETVADLFAFSTIVSDRPFQVGDFIATPNVEGVVVSIGPRSTRIRRLDQAYVSIPNAMIAKNLVVNWSRLDRRQINFVLGVSYGTTPDQMRALLERLRAMLREHPHVAPETVQVYFNEFGDSALNILVRCYIAQPDWAAFQAEREAINLKTLAIVDELGLNIAYPSRSIYVHSLPSEWSSAAYNQPAAPSGGDASRGTS
ncbi:MAG: mechanosensitive ion channel family protein [Aggregatilineales bacterium]